MNLGQARVLIAGRESEAKLLAIYTPRAQVAGEVDVATSKEQAWRAIDSQANALGLDIVITAARLPGGTTAPELVGYADRQAPISVPSVLVFSANPDELEAARRAIPGAETLLSPFEISDFKKKLHDLAIRRR